MNSVFFLYTSCHNKVKEHSLPYNLSTARGKMLQCHSQVYEHYMKCKQPCPAFEHGSPCPFPTMMAITLWAPPLHVYCHKPKYICILVYIVLQNYKVQSQLAILSSNTCSLILNEKVQVYCLMYFLKKK